MATQALAKNQAQGSQLITVEEYIKKNEHLIRRALNNTIDVDRFLAVVNIVMQSPALTGCSQNSLVSAVLQTVQIGLTPGQIGHVYYVPFYKGQVREVQMIIGYRGLVELVNRSKEATILSSFVVYEKDYFEYENGLNPVLKHRPFAGDRGEMIGVYCIAKNNIANEKVFIYLQKEEVEKVKRESLNKIAADKRQYSPWVKWEEMMWCKTSVRRIAKLLPLSIEIQQGIEADETIKTAISPKMTDAPDKTDWNTVTDAEVVRTPHSDGANPSQDSPQQENASSNNQGQPESAVRGSNVKLEALEVGEVLSEIELLVKSVKFMANVGKNGITHFKCEYADGSECFVSKWGKMKEDVTGALCLFLEVKCEEYNGAKQFKVEKVVVK